MHRILSEHGITLHTSAEIEACMHRILSEHGSALHHMQKLFDH